MADRVIVGPTELAARWAESGAQWLTDSAIGVPLPLVRSVIDLVRALDGRGAGIAADVGAGGVGLLGERAAVLGLGPSSDVSAGGATRLLRSADGWLAVSLPRPDDLDLLPAWLGVASGDDPWHAVSTAVRRVPGAEAVHRAGLLGLACALVGEAGAAHAVVHRLVGPVPARPLTGMVVANLGALWAGPLAADVLARLGARVVTVESIGRPDGARATPPFFEALHARTESVALDLTSGAGRVQLRELLARVDIVIEGSRPRALAQLGVDAVASVATGPRVWVSITAHGRDGDAGGRIGYGDDAAAAGGLVGWVGGAPRFLADAVADPLTGLTAAAAVLRAVELGGRWLLDVALARVAASTAPRTADDWAEAHGDPLPPRPRAGRGEPLPLGRDTARVLRDLGVPA